MDKELREQNMLEKSKKFEEDISIFGVAIEKDGKRIDPRDFYKNIPTPTTKGRVR